eukprot:CAMPEP_0182852372 /NCGR_PEP_ID=MMETSP0034_2-20130328/129_1 /TAXON_ID=156128 /ORGANISM="Nephroselmis pyriformis, Strain CCMP717" /LENGTH=60 /DNA_ID=CAMNT_0024983077 /DNA_START=199 /DNA_END=381 /DNA_ORIENTATION=+
MTAVTMPLSPPEGDRTGTAQHRSNMRAASCVRASCAQWGSNTSCSRCTHCEQPNLRRVRV